MSGQICWPFEEVPVKRTRKSLIEDAKKADEQNTSVSGVKGASPLMLIKQFDMSKGVVIDYMHGILLGVVRKLLDLWLQPCHRGNTCYIGNQIAALDKRLLAIEVPNVISRKPRSLHEVSSWKANEPRSWLLHYSLPVLYGILPPLYYLHFSLLVSSISC